jgi:hypothetical protein
VYARPLIEDGFLYDSYFGGEDNPRDESRNTYFEIPKERIHEQVHHDEGRKNGV